MTDFPHDHIKPFADAGSKKQQISQMFDAIAGRYDFMNRFLSAGIDVGWRRKAIGLLKKEAPRHLLDVATGTGDMAIMAARMLQPQQITGIDISPGMLEIGRQKIQKAGLAGRIALHTGDSETIGFAGNTFDAAMVAFGVRNFENLEQGLGEIRRVLRPGALLVVLEFSRPEQRIVKSMYNLYMGRIAPRLARLFNQNRQAYEYLNASANAFPDRGRFVEILRKVGFSEAAYRPLTLGICCIYTGRKPIE